MSGTLHLHWTIISTTSPVLLLHCSHCGQERRFASSGRFRLNANGRKLDAWLVYRCHACNNSWNRPIFERRSRNEIVPALMDALHGNDPALAERIAFDLSGTGHRWVDGETTIVRTALPPFPDEAERLAIRIAMTAQRGGRADRLIAQGLGLSRGEVEALAAAGRLVIADAGRKALSRPLREGMSIMVDLSGRGDGQSIAARARGA